jgi:hypothetical protein
MSKVLTDRWERLFNEATDAVTADLKAIYAEHSAKGLLRSGATIKRAVACYEARMTEAVDQSCRAISIRHSKASLLWRRNFKALINFLEAYFQRTGDGIGPAIKIAGQDIDSSAGKAGSALFRAAQGRLVRRVSDYAAGWTADDAKSWHEKNPIKWAMLLLFLGAIVSAAFAVVIK